LDYTCGENWKTCLWEGPDEPPPNGGGHKGGRDSTTKRVESVALDIHTSEVRKEMVIDVSKGLLVLGQAIQSTWWEWTSGSSLVFWQWNGKEQKNAARDGINHVFMI